MFADFQQAKKFTFLNHKKMESHLIVFAIGIIIGIIMAVKVGLGTTISNEIGKIKGNDGIVNVDQQIPPKIGIFKRIFKRK